MDIENAVKVDTEAPSGNNRLYGGFMEIVIWTASIFGMIGIFFSGVNWHTSKSWWDVLVAIGCSTSAVFQLSLYLLS